MKILGTLNINGNQEDFQLNLPDDVANKTLALFEEAQMTILQNIEEEEQSKVFDEWLKSKDSSLHKSLMSEFMSELHLRLQEGSVFDDGDCCSLDGVLPPVGVDDNYWWPENQNIIEIESFKRLKK